MRPERVIRGTPPRVEADPWRLALEEDALPEAFVIVPLAAWIAHRDTPAAPTNLGVWLGPADDPDSLRGGDLTALSVIAVHFPKAADGRGYSSAVLLRRLGYRGELRAFGDIGRDHLFFLQRCGFDAFSLPPDRDPEAALAAFGEFSLNYQGSVDDPTPLYRRRAGSRPAP